VIDLMDTRSSACICYCCVDIVDKRERERETRKEEIDLFRFVKTTNTQIFCREQNTQNEMKMNRKQARVVIFCFSLEESHLFFSFLYIAYWTRCACLSSKSSLVQSRTKEG
jgi:hypothetical protein